MNRQRCWHWVCGLMLGLRLSAGAGPATNLVPNGDFEAGDDWAPPWPKMSGASVVREDGRRFLRIERGGLGVPLRIELHPDWWTLRLSLRMRVHGVERGDESWKDARLAMSFHGADGSRVGEWPAVPHASGTSDWFEFEREYLIPRGAKTLLISASNLGRTGRADFDDIRIVVGRVRPERPVDAPLPEGFAGDPWEAAAAATLSSRTRARLCVNGLWRFRPVLPGDEADRVPPGGSHWGWFKVPGIWPSGEDDLETAPQVIHAAPSIDPRDCDLRNLERAWYRRRIQIPAGWAGRRVRLVFTMLQTHAAVFVDGRAVGEVWFPGGELDITDSVRPGGAHELALRVTARPLKNGRDEFLSPEEAARQSAGVRLRGITGDVFLESVPTADRIRDVRAVPSVGDRRLGLDIGLENISRAAYRLWATVRHRGHTLRTFEWDRVEPREGRVAVAADWADAPLWDVDTPENLLELSVALCDEQGTILDEMSPVRFGFRDIRIAGRDILLNGVPIHLRALHVATANSAAHMADAEAAERLVERMREYGFNFLIMANYDVRPGEIGYLDALLDACDRRGILMSFSLPHARDFEWKLDEPAFAAAYRRLAEWLIRRVQNHPAVIFYAMNHNSTGYYGDQNPLKMDGVFDPDLVGRAPSASRPLVRRRSRAQAELAADIARRLDPDRPIYHHHSGNLGDLYTVNIYLNWAPLQERSDWLAHWSTAGRKPMFFVEWGLPHIASWSSYRGPLFIWRNPALQCAWVAEFAAAYLGGRAYASNPALDAVLEVEERLWAEGRPFYWGELASQLSRQDSMHQEVVAQFAADNWRSHRAWGISAMLPWDQARLWRRVRPTATVEHPARYRDLQRPGIVPDFRRAEDQYIYDPGPREHFEPTAIGRVFARWNQPLCAFIGGDPSDHGPGGPTAASERRFTEKRHLVLPGSRVTKSVVVLNDTRRTRRYRYEWQLGEGRGAERGDGRGTIEAGGRHFLPLTARVPASAPPGPLRLQARVEFDTGELQTDEFVFTVLSARRSDGPDRAVRLLDPVGATEALLRRVDVPYRGVSLQGEDLRPGDVVVIGERAWSHPDLCGRPMPLFRAVSNGVRVLVLAQDIERMWERGFRANLHALRQFFVRSAAHPALAGLRDVHFAYWNGASTLIPPYLETPAFEPTDPTWLWQGFRNTRVWRAGNLHAVASVLVEKPERGDWLPLVDGGFDLQYSPLLETTVGAGRLVFCQLEVAHRTSPEPVAEDLVRRLLRHLQSAPAASARRVLYAGDDRGATLLRDLGVDAAPLPSAVEPSASLLLVAGPGARPPQKLQEAVEAGAHVLALGLDAELLRAWAPGLDARPSAPVSRAEFGDDVGAEPLLRGISPAELYWRTRPTISALRGEGHPALRVWQRGRGAVVALQVAPWHFDAERSPRLRTTCRRTLWLVSRLLHNLGAAARNPVVELLEQPAVPVAICWTNGWRGQPDPKREGRTNGWWRADHDDRSWPLVQVPSPIHLLSPEMNGYSGPYWYRLAFDLPPGFEQQDLTLELGPTGAESWVWLNDELLDEVTWKSHPKTCHVHSRSISLPRNRLRERGNQLVVLVHAAREAGGILTPPYLARPGPWLRSFYLQPPVADDDPYRYYRW
ncbi:MAG: hypothetical protein N2652_05785 [Kiritimatiellae bacterium]|nr:hypothetical protein [Kiritimatiellia bacterium]